LSLERKTEKSRRVLKMFHITLKEKQLIYQTRHKNRANLKIVEKSDIVLIKFLAVTLQCSNQASQLLSTIEHIVKTAKTTEAQLNELDEIYNYVSNFV
jgi:hypothetical protein